MAELPETRESLLLKLRDPADAAAWERFVSVYRPAVYRFARRCGLQHADADDLAQQVVAAVLVEPEEQALGKVVAGHWARYSGSDKGRHVSARPGSGQMGQ